jgi:3-isopropylmalate dehydratase small subunit
VGVPYQPLYPALSGTAWTLPPDGAGGLQLQALPGGFAAGDFVVGGLGCGAGSHAGAAGDLRAAGVAALIARSFDPAFLAAALACGLPALAVEEAPAIKSGDRLRVDVETNRVVNLSSGDRYVIRNLTDAAVEQLRRSMPR